MNLHVRDNLNVLKTRIRDAGSLRTVLTKSVAAAGNVAAAETTLAGYGVSVLAGELADGDGYECVGAGVFANNANSKIVRIGINAARVNIVTSAVALAGNVFTFRIRIMRTAVASAIVFGSSTTDAVTTGVPTVQHCASIVSSLNWALATVIVLTAQGGLTNDIVMAAGAISDKFS
jgi:hypothetical protein